MRSLRGGLGSGGGIGILGQRGEAPDLSVAEIDDHFAEDLFAAIGCAKEGDSGLDIDGVVIIGLSFEES